MLLLEELRLCCETVCYCVKNIRWFCCTELNRPDSPGSSLLRTHHSSQLRLSAHQQALDVGPEPAAGRAGAAEEAAAPPSEPLSRPHHIGPGPSAGCLVSPSDIQSGDV